MGGPSPQDAGKQEDEGSRDPPLKEGGWLGLYEEPGPSLGDERYQSKAPFQQGIEDWWRMDAGRRPSVGPTQRRLKKVGFEGQQVQDRRLQQLC